MWRLAAAMMVVWSVSACADGCANQTVASSLAPDGRHTAVLFVRDCGATTDYATQVSVSASGAIIVGAGNAFVADTNHSATAANNWAGPWADLRWLSPTHLVIRYDAKAHVFLSKASVDGVTISTEAVAR